MLTLITALPGNDIDEIQEYVKTRITSCITFAYLQRMSSVLHSLELYYYLWLPRTRIFT